MTLTTFALKCQNTDNKWRVNTKDRWDHSVMNLTLPSFWLVTFSLFYSFKLQQRDLKLPSLHLCLNSSPSFCSARWIKISSSSRCGPGSKSPCMQRTYLQVTNPPCMCVLSQLPRTAFVPCVASGTKHRNSSQSGVFYYLTNNPNSVSDWLPPCSYTETFREWTSLQVCVPLPIGDAATVLKGLIR